MHIELTKVCWKSNQLPPNQLKQCIERRVFDRRIFMRDAQFMFERWNEYYIAFHRAMVHVVAVVGYLPAEVWREKNRVRNLGGP